MKPRLLLFIAAACLLSGGAAAAGDAERQIESLQAQIQQREAEIAALRQKIVAVQRQQRSQTDTTTPVSPRRPDTQSSPRTAAAVRSVPRPAPTAKAQNADEDKVLATALETALVRQGGRVLSQGAIEVEPELSYFYDEPVRGQRRDTFDAALTARVGLPWATQVELRLPYVLSDRWTGVGTSSGIGDIRLGLTNELVSEREWIPALLAFAQWRTTTGDINRNPPTGFGQNAVQVGLTTVKRQDPIVLFGSLSYTANLGSAHLRSGSRRDLGDIFGGRLGTFLSVTPDTSLMLAVTADSFSATRVNGQRVTTSDRLEGVLEIGAATTIGRDLFLNVTTGIGVTPAAPNFSLIVSVPYRF